MLNMLPSDVSCNQVQQIALQKGLAPVYHGDGEGEDGGAEVRHHCL